jgi:hypothetical protein
LRRSRASFGESAIFVAEDFLVRGKPPAVISTPVGRAD